jgi:arabinan endo-1,5-alpha-L-arabinosidase
MKLKLNPSRISGMLGIVLLACGCAGPKQEIQKTVRTYQNPVFAGDMPDPTVQRFGEYYYAVGTTGKRRLADGRIFRMLRSRDLVTWEALGGALVPPNDNLGYQYWAPELTENQGKYYLYYSMGGLEAERFEIRVGISDQPQGPYVDSGKVLIDCETNRFTIDPFPYRAEDGQWYMYYACNFPKEDKGLHAGTGIVVDRLIDMTRLSGERQVVLRASHDWTLYESNRWMEVYGQTFNWHTIEGPCVLQRGGKIYCFYSGANWQTPRYGVDYVVAKHPLGPYSGAASSARVLHGIPGQVQGPGHNSIVTGPDGKTQYVVYHAWDKNMKRRQLCVDKLEWTAKGPRCIPTVTPQPAP